MTRFRFVPAAVAAVWLAVAALPAMAVEPSAAPDPAAEAAAQPSSTYKVHVGGMT